MSQRVPFRDCSEFLNLCVTAGSIEILRVNSKTRPVALPARTASTLFATAVKNPSENSRILLHGKRDHVGKCRIKRLPLNGHRRSSDRLAPLQTRIEYVRDSIGNDIDGRLVPTNALGSKCLLQEPRIEVCVDMIDDFFNVIAAGLRVMNGVRHRFSVRKNLTRHVKVVSVVKSVNAFV